MNQTTTTTVSANTQPLDLDALHLLLKEVRKSYDNNPGSTQARERLLHTLQINDCREIVAVVVNGDSFANIFVLAGFRGHVDILQAFLHHGMNVDIKDENDWTALIEATCNDHEECVRFLLDRLATVDVQDHSGETALLFAGKRGKIKIVEMLLEKNANCDHQSKKGMTALMFASAHGRKEIVQALLNHGVNTDLKNKDGETALDLAWDEEIKELLLNHVNTSFLLK